MCSILVHILVPNTSSYFTRIHLSRADLAFIRWLQEWVILWGVLLPINSAPQHIRAFILRGRLPTLCPSDHPLHYSSKGFVLTLCHLFIWLSVNIYWIPTTKRLSAGEMGGGPRLHDSTSCTHARERKINERSYITCEVLQER